MNIEEKENAEGNKNNPNLNNISSFLINFIKNLPSTLIFYYCDNLSFIKYICIVWLRWDYLKNYPFNILFSRNFKSLKFSDFLHNSSKLPELIIFPSANS